MASDAQDVAASPPPHATWTGVPVPPSLAPGARRPDNRLIYAAIGLLVVLGLALGFWAFLPAGQALRKVAIKPPTIAAKPTPPTILPPSDPTALEPLTEAEATAANARIPIAAGPNPPGRTLHITSASTDLQPALDCLTAAIYYEAGWEPVDGQRAVAQVVINRIHHPAFPHTVCGVVFEGSDRVTGCQFSFTCDGSMLRPPEPERWRATQAIALAALSGRVFKPVGLSTHYHADYVVPYWAPTLLKTAVIGRHIFYRWNAGWGAPPAFTEHYAGSEPAPTAAAEPDPNAVDATTPQANGVANLTDRPILDGVGHSLPGNTAPAVLTLAQSKLATPQQTPSQQASVQQPGPIARAERYVIGMDGNAERPTNAAESGKPAPGVDKNGPQPR